MFDMRTVDRKAFWPTFEIIEALWRIWRTPGGTSFERVWLEMNDYLVTFSYDFRSNVLFDGEVPPKEVFQSLSIFSAAYGSRVRLGRRTDESVILAS